MQDQTVEMNCDTNEDSEQAIAPASSNAELGRSSRNISLPSLFDLCLQQIGSDPERAMTLERIYGLGDQLLAAALVSILNHGTLTLELLKDLKHVAEQENMTELSKVLCLFTPERCYQEYIPDPVFNPI